MGSGVVRRRRLFERLDAAARVVEVSAPGGSGKTVLLHSWIADSGLAGRVGWVAVRREERDFQRFWVSVAEALRATVAGSELVRPVTAAPDLDGWAVVEWLLKDLAGVQDRIWLVIDDVHELRPAEALRQLELLIMRAPPEVRFVLATRHDLSLGLHRLRLEGELTEVRAADLRFTAEEARALLDGAGVQLPGPSLALLLERAEGWAAGLRLAALSLAGHPDPEGFVTGFSGSERTVAEYLLAEVLGRQPKSVRRLLLRTSVLERVNGELADLLTGRSGGGRILQDLEQAGAFVVPLDAQRSWFRYHRLFADLLQFELRASEPDALPVLHAAAARWFAGHGFGVEAIRHAQAAGDWAMAARLLADRWLDLALGGQAATGRQLLAAFPAEMVASDAELTAMWAASEITGGALEEAERHLARAAAGSASVPTDRRGGFDVLLAGQQLRLARKRNDLPAVAEQAQQLLALADAAHAVQHGRDEDVRALALVSLGTAELLSQRLDQAERHLEQGTALARRIGRPFVEVTGLAQWANAATHQSLALAAERATQAIEVAQRHGWAEHQALSAAHTALATAMIWQGNLAAGERSLRDAERVLRAEVENATEVLVHYLRGILELAYGRLADALAAFRTADRRAGSLVSPHLLARQVRALLLVTWLRSGDTSSVEQVLASLDAAQRGTGEIRAAAAALRLARSDPGGALRELAPVLDGSASVIPPARIGAFLVAALAHDAAGDPAAAEKTLERALDLAEPEGILLPFLIHPAPQLLERHSRPRTAHAALVLQIRGLLAQNPGGGDRSAIRGAAASETWKDHPPGAAGSLREPLSDTETRVLRYLPTNLTTPEIAGELYLSVNTIKTHIRHLYEKLGAHRRAEAVERARALGLLAPSHQR